jgi:hypothetical protein
LRRRRRPCLFYAAAPESAINIQARAKYNVVCVPFVGDKARAAGAIVRANSSFALSVQENIQIHMRRAVASRELTSWSC